MPILEIEELMMGKERLGNQEKGGPCFGGPREQRSKCGDRSMNTVK